MQASFQSPAQCIQHVNLSPDEIRPLMTTRKTICFGAMKMNLPAAPSVNGPGHKWSGKKCRKKGGKKGASLLGAKDKRRVPLPSLPPSDDDDLLSARL